MILEQGQPLSRSRLWQLQRAYFARAGIQAWRQATVPHYITSNPFIAQAYARAVLGFLRDCHAGAGGEFAPLDSDQPLYIVELGAGSGRFAYHFLKKFRAILEASPLKDLSVRYVMTDLSESLLDYWRAHAWLKPLVAAGHLDFARHDAESEAPLVLDCGAVLAPGRVMNPLVVIANYCFDGLPADAFRIEQGQLYESLVTLASSQPEPDVADPDMLPRVTISYEPRPVDGDYYHDPDLDDILQHYRRTLAPTHLLFPCAALRCMRQLSRLAAGRLLLLSADKGYSHAEDLLDRDAPGMAAHGSISFMVNYHALGRYVLAQGGQFLHTPHRHAHIEVGAFLLGRHPGGYPETRLAYTEAVERGGPDDFFGLKKGIEMSYDALDAQQLLAYLRLSGWDANVFAGCCPTLAKHAASASEDLRQEMYWACRHVWDTYYPIGEPHDLAFQIGTLLSDLGFYAAAIEFFERSIALYGLDPATAYDIALCYNDLHRWEEALACVDQALTLDPSLEAARALRIQVQAQLQRGAEAARVLPQSGSGI